MPEAPALSRFLVQLRFSDIWGLLGAIVDIGIVAFVFYKLFTLIRGTRAVQLIKGILVLLVATKVAQWLQLYTIHWLLRNIQVALVVALPIVFQPELRRALEQLGRGRLFARPYAVLGAEGLRRLVDEVARAVEILSRNKIGALIVLERETGLKDIAETGTAVDGLVSAEMLVNIFIPNTPLHDGAVVIRGDRVLAAGCFLPLSDAANLARELGTRHRAAVGVTEHSDAVAVVVSEETGAVSLASAGKLIRNVDDKTLREMVTSLLEPTRVPGLGLLGQRQGA